jgi:hypothetical protein
MGNQFGINLEGKCVIIKNAKIRAKKNNVKIDELIGD